MCQAAEVFSTGQSAYNQGDYQRAALAFEQAARIAPNAAAWHAAGEAWDRAGAADRAATDYERCISLGLDEPRATEVAALLEQRRAQLARVEIDEPAGASASIGYLRNEPVPTGIIYLRPGPHQLAVKPRAGAERSRSLTLTAGQLWRASEQVSVAQPSPAPASPRSAPAAAPEPRTSPDDGATMALRVSGGIALALGAFAGAAAVVLGVRTVRENDAFEESGLRDVGAHDRAVRLRTWTNVAAFGGGALGAAGLTMLLVPLGLEPSQSAGVRLGPADVQVRVVF
jgi:tetratricopeptide (TPR) repeat protein